MIIIHRDYIRRLFFAKNTLHRVEHDVEMKMKFLKSFHQELKKQNSHKEREMAIEFLLTRVQTQQENIDEAKERMKLAMDTYNLQVD